MSWWSSYRCYTWILTISPDSWRIWLVRLYLTYGVIRPRWPTALDIIYASYVTGSGIPELAFRSVFVFVIPSSWLLSDILHRPTYDIAMTFMLLTSPRQRLSSSILNSLTRGYIPHTMSHDVIDVSIAWHILVSCTWITRSTSTPHFQ